MSKLPIFNFFISLGREFQTEIPMDFQAKIFLFNCHPDDDKESNRASASDDVSSSNASYTCYENLTVYHPIYLEVRLRSRFLSLEKSVVHFHVSEIHCVSSPQLQFFVKHL